MKSDLALLGTSVLLGLLAAGHSAAIVVRGDAPIDAVHVEPDDFPDVIALLDGRAVGTLIDESWILTAAHVAQFVGRDNDSRQVSIGRESRRITEVVIHPSWSEDELGGQDVFDLALLRLSDPVSGVSPAPLYQDVRELNAVVQLYGWGRTGNGEDENLVRDGRFRRGENRVDAISPRLRFKFDAPDSDRALLLEAVSGPGDSGGPAFIESEGVRYLAGVSSFQEDVTAPGIYGVVENYERVSDHVEWIESIIAR